MTQLLAVNTENRPRYGAFEKSYDTCLKEYMSRIFPHRADRFAELTEAGLLLWDYILCGGKPVGSVWLEKESAEEETAVLGIFLAEESCRGKHVGEEAVRLICRDGAEKMGISSVELHVRPQNSRAVRCYRKCGFEEAGRFVKPNGVEVIHMIRKL